MKIRKEFDFIGRRKIFYILSLCLIAITIIFSFVFGIGLDIQFKGGSIINYQYEGEINTNEIQSIAKDILKNDVKIIEKDGFGDLPDTFEISLTEDIGVDSTTTSDLTNALTKKYGNNIKLLEINNVDPVIGREFFAKSFVAVGFAAIILIIYIAIRFKKIGGWSAGVMGVVALLHDVLIVFGTFVICRFPLDYNFIAVVLTILGYSINDTIVIYDRIRENNRHYKNTKNEGEIVNISINQCITRSTNTTISTIISMLVICIVSILTGVESIITFAFPMIIGMISGVYSTIFIAGPLWVDWQNYKTKRAKLKKTKA